MEGNKNDTSWQQRKLLLDTEPSYGSGDPQRLCPWLKGSSMLEVFGINCSKLHHKIP